MLPLAMLETATQPAPPPRPGAYYQYRAQQVLSASPMQLVLMLYELAITGCEARDAERAGKPITELIGALNFDYGEIATDLFRLYEYCHWEIRRGRFREAAEILRGLKRAWEEALAGRAAV
ncbi:MAG TPA: flagellar export chaperone FliS [Candidatus Methylomirabilis sp.]|nr:flagellar export chaperone FliS [Candidatus Methylomirabilis sp.]